MSFLTFTACEWSDENIAPLVEKNPVPESSLILGKRLENPYTVDNMKRAFQNLTANGRTEDLEISTTHWYVKFTPKDSLELIILQRDTTLILWDYPLDREVEVIGHAYHDPELPADVPTYQYTVVKPNFQFDSVSFEVLEELFLPELYLEPNGRISEGFLDALENEALRITGNLEGVHSGGRLEASRWTPSGRVTVREVTGVTPSATSTYLPVKNVKVKGKVWFYLSQTYTDTNGNFRLNSTKREVDYKIEFESERVKVTNFLGWSRNHNGPNNQRKSWNPAFNFWTESWANATILNAAYEGRRQVNLKGMQSPFPNTFWAGNGNAVDKLNIRVKYAEGTGRMVTHPWSINEIKIWTDFSDGRGHKGTDWLYRVVFHELGHSMHARLSGSIAFTSPIIRESWADFVEHYFSIEYYTTLQHLSDKQSQDLSDWLHGYTPLFIDVRDIENQSITEGSTWRPDDRVEWYTFAQIQSSLVDNTRLKDVEDHLKGYSNPTKGNLTVLFDFYKELE
jgi:hypothetical protein